MRPRHRGQLQTVSVGELPQELPQAWPAHTPARTGAVIPPERITCRSSMLSAPAAIPAMIELSFPAGFTPAETTRVCTELDPLGDQLRQPGLLGQRHHRDQAGIRHQMLIVEQRRGRGPRVR